MFFKLFSLVKNAGKAAPEQMRKAEVRRAFNAITGWAAAYLVASIIAGLAAVVVPHQGDEGTIVSVWIRCAVVILVAAVINVLAAVARRGNRGSYLVLRVWVWLESIACVLVALVVPGYPLWLRLVTVLIGGFAVGVAVTTTNRNIRAAFAVAAA